MKNTVIFYKDWYDSLKGLSPEERLAIYEAVMRYAFEGEEPQDKLVKYATALMRKAIDRDNGKYDEVSRKRKEAAEKRWQERKSMQTMQVYASDTNNADNDNDNVNDNDNDNDNEPTNVGNKEKTSKEGKKKVATTSGQRRFVKPTVEEVEAYCRERGNSVDAQHFVDFYESKGWKVGSNAMKDWRAAVRTWEKRDGRSAAQAPKGVTLGVGEWIDERGERRYGSGQHTVPMSAPPRPGDDCYWSGESHNWVSGV